MKTDESQTNEKCKSDSVGEMVKTLAPPPPQIGDFLCFRGLLNKLEETHNVLKDKTIIPVRQPDL